ncbi:MAG: bifunctional metallophosphatase/5'-nucleotidase [Candidatus Izimaplasma sp.]|nr:bifunctional metallophosphatase/5'-nucleotidase [Candidatus Izimaplasma bacterium]
MAQTFNFRVLQTSDVHGYIYPISYSSKEKMDIGLAQISTLLKKYRTTNTIVIDTGDTIQGSPLTYHHAKENVGKQNPLSKVYNYLNYDFITIGNHEFNYGRNYLDNYISYLDAKIINSNLIDKATSTPLYGKEYEIIRYEDGPTIAIIGATTHYIPNWEQPTHIKGITFIDAFEAIKEIVKKIKKIENPDFIIVSYHGGFERDLETHEFSMEDTGENQGYKILKEIPDVDLLLTGHQHRTLAGKLFNTYYTQPALNGTALGLIDIEFYNEENVWKYNVNNIEILSTRNIIPDTKLLNLVTRDEEATQIFLDTPIGKTKHDLLITDQLEARLHKHPLVSFINQVQLEYSHADISSCSLGNDVSGFRKEITIRDVIGTYVFPNSLVVKAVKGSTLLIALEKTAEFFELENNKVIFSPKFNTPKLQLYAYDMYDNLNYTIDLRKPHSERISNVTFNNLPLELDKEYNIVMNNYRAAGGGDYLFIKECRTVKVIQIDVIELLINYIFDKKEIEIKTTDNIKIIY